MGKGIINFVGLIFVFGAVYQILHAPKQANAVLQATAGDVNALSTALHG